MDSSRREENLLNLVADYFEPEHMMGPDQYYCGSCAKKVDAVKTPQLLASPSFFTLGLNRFEWDPVSYQRVKIYKKVQIPYLLDTVKAGISNGYYMLLGIIFHQGSESNGHYFSVVRSIDDAQKAYTDNTYHVGSWTHCNDRTKEVIDYRLFNRWMNSYGDPSPYQCIYYKVHQIATPASIVIPNATF